MRLFLVLRSGLNEYPMSLMIYPVANYSLIKLSTSFYIYSKFAAIECTITLPRLSANILKKHECAYSISHNPYLNTSYFYSYYNTGFYTLILHSKPDSNPCMVVATNLTRLGVYPITLTVAVNLSPNLISTLTLLACLLYRLSINSSISLLRNLI